MAIEFFLFVKNSMVLPGYVLRFTIPDHFHQVHSVGIQMSIQIFLYFRSIFWNNRFEYLDSFELLWGVKLCAFIWMIFYSFERGFFHWIQIEFQESLLWKIHKRRIHLQKSYQWLKRGKVTSLQKQKIFLQSSAQFCD